MRWLYFVLMLSLAVPPAFAEGLPDLGDVAQSEFSPLYERQLGESIMREIRGDPAYYDDAEAIDYLNALGERLASHSSDARQSFEFFLVRDRQINAFALPGGFIGVNTGLFLNAQSESEVASVLAHEIGHVVQRHIVRMLAQQKNTGLISLAALAVALLAARGNSDFGQAAAAFGQASLIQSQLNFTRENEREADRVGMQILENSGFDPRAMVSFFERLQRATRVYEGGAPSYLQTHPLTYERIADMQNRVDRLPYRQVPDSLEFQLIRAKLRVVEDGPAQSVEYFRKNLAEGKYLSEAAARYGLALARLLDNDRSGARKEFAALRKIAKPSPVIDALDCRIRSESGDAAGAMSCYTEALKRYPGYRAFVYDYADLLLLNGRAQDALKLVEGRLQTHSGDYKLYLLQARSYAKLNKRLAQHRAQGEAYARMGDLPAAVEQLQLAVKSGDGDFYQLSSAEARLRELRRMNEEQKREKKAEEKK